MIQEAAHKLVLLASTNEGSADPSAFLRRFFLITAKNSFSLLTGSSELEKSRT